MIFNGRLVASATAIFRTQGLNRPGPPFKLEYDPLKISMPESEFELGTFCPVASALTARQTIGCHMISKLLLLP